VLRVAITSMSSCVTPSGSSGATSMTLTGTESSKRSPVSLTAF